jgi:outer membrane protein TolC
MRSRTYLVAAVLGAFGSLLVTHQAAADRDFEDDGPEAEAAALIKLDDLIEAAVTHSPDLARAKADRNIAKGSAGAARADQQWVMSASANYKRDAIGDHVTSEPFQVVATDEINGVLGLGRKLPSGGSIQLELGIGHTTKELDIPAGYGSNDGGAAAGGGSGSGSAAAAGLQLPPIEDHFTQISTTARVTLKQPLVRGFGPEVALAQEKRADFAMAESTIKAQLAAEDMVKELVSGYWELAFASFELDTRTEAVELAQAQEKLTREEYRAGQAPQNAVNAVVYEIAVRKEAQLRAALAFEKMSLDLRRKAGLELGRRRIVMRPGEPFEISDAEWDVEDVLERSRKANRKLATIALQKKAADVDVKVSSNAMLPQVDVSLSGALIGTGGTSDQSIAGLTAADGFEVMAGLSVSFELSGAAKSAHDAATSRRRRLDIDREDLERQIDVEVVSSVHQVTAARTRVALSDKAISMAEDNLKAERLSFQAGKSTNFNVMQRQTQLIDARINRGRAVADYHVSVAQLQYLSGTILEQYRVNVRPGAGSR